jgi:hypothetical protein
MHRGRVTNKHINFASRSNLNQREMELATTRVTLKLLEVVAREGWLSEKLVKRIEVHRNGGKQSLAPVPSMFI